MTAVVIGVGNRWRGDDASGLEVAALVRDARLPGVAVFESDGDPAGLLDRWHGADLAIVVDAVSSGAAPGTVLRYEGAAIPATLFRHSTHALGPGEAFALAGVLGRAPRRLVLYGIEAARFEPGRDMTDAVAAAVPEAAARVIAEAGPKPAGPVEGGG